MAKKAWVFQWNFFLIDRMFEIIDFFTCLEFFGLWIDRRNKSSNTNIGWHFEIQN